MTIKASFIGLGNMGAAMASNLLKHGVQLGVYNRTPEKAASLLKAGATLLNNPSEAFKHAPVVLSMVANDQALEEICEGPNGLLAQASPECIHISLSTVSPATTQKLLLKHKEKGALFVASPVFGRPDVAARQELWICMSGEKAAKTKAEPFLNMIGKKIYDFGDSAGAANAVKLSGNFMILSVIEMLGEAFAFAEKSAVEPEKLYAFLTETLFPSPVFLTYGKIVYQQKFSPAGFAMNLGLKDISLFLEAVKALKVSSPIGEVLKKQVLTSLDEGRKDMDWSAITLLSKEAGDKE